LPLSGLEMRSLRPSYSPASCVWVKRSAAGCFDICGEVPPMVLRLLSSRCIAARFIEQPPRGGSGMDKIDHEISGTALLIGVHSTGDEHRLGFSYSPPGHPTSAVSIVRGISASALVWRTHHVTPVGCPGRASALPSGDCGIPGRRIQRHPVALHAHRPRSTQTPEGPRWCDITSARRPAVTHFLSAVGPAGGGGT